MSLDAGTRLGPYTLDAKIGAGGMGEVYRARDTRLDRTVAIKVLPPTLAADPERRARFEQEARAVAALSHPHICAIHDVGREGEVDYLVLEYLEGETLADRLARAATGSGGSLSIGDTISLAVPIAEALAAAHRAGIVHRDLKPSNIFLTKAGPKLLDFGLAKIVAAQAPSPVHVSALPTTPAGLTVQGTILGTFQYMAPEQLEGQEADARTDIWAFGCVMYEMLTARKAFEGRTQASLIAAILEREPTPIPTLQPLAPPAVHRLIATCLAKDPDDRWQNARDLARELKATLIVPAMAPQEAAPTAPRARLATREAVAWTCAALSVSAALGLGVMLNLTGARPELPLRRLSLLLPPNSVRSGRQIALSPDGRMLAFAGTSQGRTMLWIRALDSLAARPLSGTEGADGPFWSPDGQWVAFLAGRQLKRVRVDGNSPPLAITDVNTTAGGGSWGVGDVILFVTSITGEILRVPVTGGVPERVTALDESRGEIGHVRPTFLPDGRHFVYLARGATESGLNLGSLDIPAGVRLTAADSGAVYADGRLLFVSGSALVALPFDVSALRITGPASTIAEAELRSPGNNGAVPVSVSTNGVLAYVNENQDRRLAWFTRNGNADGSLSSPGSYGDVELDPSGLRVLVKEGVDYRILDVMGGAITRLARPGAQLLRWAPNGTDLAASVRLPSGENLLVRMASNGAAAEQVLVRGSDGVIPSDWSHDWRWLVFRRVPAGGPGGLWVMPMTGRGDPAPLEGASVRGLNGRFSPDGRWVVYTSEETGRAEVYVQPFPGAGAKFQVSRQGGVRPRWRRDGREIYFIAAAESTGTATIFAAPVNTDGAFRAGDPQPLLPSPFLPDSTNDHPYDVSPDGQRFLVIVPAQDVATSPITIVTNWTAGLSR